MKTKDNTAELVDEVFEFTEVINEPLKKPITVSNLWVGFNGPSKNFVIYPRLPVKKFNKAEIEALEAQMKKVGKL